MTAFRVTPADLLSLSQQVHGTAGSIESELGTLRNKLYRMIASNALSPARFYHLPTNRVVELGTQIAI